jgi:hypothetical protein
MQLIKKKHDDPKSVSLMKKYFKMGINYDREFLKYKLEKMNEKEIKGLENNFDKNIKQLMQKMELDDETIIVGDISYNISVKLF